VPGISSAARTAIPLAQRGPRGAVWPQKRTVSMRLMKGLVFRLRQPLVSQSKGAAYFLDSRNCCRRLSNSSKSPVFKSRNCQNVQPFV
jgi:hypothetical protein